MGFPLWKPGVFFNRSLFRLTGAAKYGRRSHPYARPGPTPGERCHSFSEDGPTAKSFPAGAALELDASESTKEDAEVNGEIKERGVGVVRAHEALNHLTRIPKKYSLTVRLKVRRHERYLVGATTTA
jgi:hypothetical protein